MSRNKRNSYRTRQEGDAPLPLSTQLAAAVQQTTVDPVGEDLGDVADQIIVPDSITKDENGTITVNYNVDPDVVDVSSPGVTYSEPEDRDKAVIWMLKNDLVKASRWATAVRSEPERLVYDLFSQEELEFTGIDFSGDDFSVATEWILDKYNEWRATAAPLPEESDEQSTTEDGSDDALDVDAATAESDTQKAEYYTAIRAKYTLPDNWTDAAVDDWISKEGYNLGLTAHGNFVYDPTRAERGIGTYKASELLDAIQGLFYENYEDRENEIAQAFLQREAVDAAWSARDLIDYLKQGLEPVKVSTGAWKNDVTRARRMAQDWTSQELQAWVKGEIQSGGETTDQKIAIEVNKRFDLGVVSVTPEDIRRVYAKIHSNAVKIVGVPVTADTPTNLQPEPAPVAETETVIPQGLTAMNIAYLKTQTERYATACKPGKAITAEAGAKEQRELDNLFRYILKIEDPAGFGNAMGFIRDFFKKNRDGLFDPQYAFRFTGSLRTEGALQETHVNLLNILQVYTDENKAARKQIDLPYLLSKFPSNRQAWLLEFFQTYC